MIKKLDKLIIRSFIGPFLATFVIALFVLVMQFVWLYLDDLVGKGLDFFTIIQLVGYVAATAVTYALPLSLLLSSIMTFGNLGETFELVAIKSSGIPLLRFMRPLLIFSILIGGVAFLFANNIIPVANLKLNSLKYDIIVKKPAFDIKEGVFFDKIEGYVIKIGKKDKDDSTIHNVVIYEKTYNMQDDFMTAESGVMRVTPDKRFLEFTLHNGWNYQENGNRYSSNTEFIRMGFDEYKKVFDLSTFEINKTPDSLFKWNPQMLTLPQLSYAIDSMGNLTSKYYKRSVSEISKFLPYLKYADSTWPPTANKSQTKPLKSFDEVIPSNLQATINDRVNTQLISIKASADLNASDYKAQKELLTKNYIEWHRKLTLSVACIVLFIIGAPLGSIIRKGGIGTPLIFAIIFFVTFHLLNTFGEKFAKEYVTTPLTGMWLSTLVLAPIGIFLTFKAMRDSQLFNKEFYFRLAKRVKLMFSSKAV